MPLKEHKGDTSLVKTAVLAVDVQTPFVFEDAVRDQVGYKYRDVVYICEYDSF